MTDQRVIVIGGGAAGLIAAGQAAAYGAQVTVVEKKPLPGLKLRITGKGRCNLTNTASLPEFLEHFNSGDKFLRSAFSRFFSSELIELFNEIGIETKTERGGRVFPENNDAANVVDRLVSWVKSNGVVIKTKLKLESLIIEGGKVTGVEVIKLSRGSDSNRVMLKADSVIIATGGASYPSTGSAGDGYRLAEAVGHTVVPIRPSLVPIETEGDIALRLQGLSLKNVNVKLFIDHKKKTEQFGEMLFTHFGLSGPVILTLSGKIVDALLSKNEVELTIDLKPALDEGKLDQRLLREIENNGKKKYSSMLKNLLPRKLIDICVEQTGIDPDKLCSQISSKERKSLGRWLRELRFKVSGYRGFEEAIITAGGVKLKEVDPVTMESKLVKGLYFAGEVLDIDADTGGYNLQAAFSTGWVAGMSAACIQS